MQIALHIFGAIFFFVHVLTGLTLPSDAAAIDATSPVHRFYSQNYQTHFYTINEQEKEYVIQNDPNWTYEGIAYAAYKTNSNESVPLYRFYSPVYEGHFYTKSILEKEYVIQNDPNWTYEGVAYYVLEQGLSVHRFYSNYYQSHFYTSSEVEKNYIIENDSNWTYEGVSFHVANKNSQEVLEDTNDLSDNPPLALCGNGLEELGEQCDDGNNVSGDGCDFACIAELTNPKVILYAMLDDADYHDVGYNSQDAVTPHIDALRSDGVTLDNFYAGSGICSPTRVSVLTGTGPSHYGLNRLWPDTSSLNSPDPPDQYFSSLRGLPEDIPFISDLHQAGYKSLHIGKWHVGDSKESFLPNARGFDTSIIFKATPYTGQLQEKVDGVWGVTTPQEWRPQYMADQIIEYIDSNKDASKVFVNWWAIAPHTPLYVPPNFDNSNVNFDLDTDRGKLLATLFEWDKQFGRVVAYLKENDLYDDSLIIFTSDNGGYKLALSPDREVSGSKGTLSEGGIRVPFVASWPNRFPAGIVNSSVVSTHDILPTLFEASGLEIPTGLDGRSVLGVLESGQSEQDESMFWQMRTRSWRTITQDPDNPDPSFQDMAFDTYALRKGCYKIIKDAASPTGVVDVNPYKLYNVCIDVAEMNDLRLSNAAKFQELQDDLLDQRKSMTRFNSVPSTVPLGGTTVEFDRRLDTHQDDLSFYADISDYVFGQTKNIYSRGEGLNITINDSGLVTAQVLGNIDQSRTNPQFKTLTLSHQLQPGQTSFTLGFVVHNYWRSAATIELYIDDILSEQIAGPFNTLATVEDIGDSIYAIKSSEDDLFIGDVGIRLSNVQFYTTALRPSEL